MTLSINGESREFPDGLTVASLIAHLGMKTDRVAVEVNLEIVPRTNWEATLLKSGDKLEIVHFVGGGSSSGEQDVTAVQDEVVEEGKESADAAFQTAAAWTCPNCGGTSTAGFCSNCGEKRFSSADLSVRHLLSHALEVVFHADSKIFRSFRLLFTRPGLLSSEYVRGRRKPYVHPFQVFFVANLIYFFVQPLTGWSGLKTTLSTHMNDLFYSPLATRMVQHRLAAKGMSLEEFARVFNHTVDVDARSLVLVMVPMFALVVWVLEWRKGRFLTEHLVFALHSYAFWLLATFIGLFGLSLPVILLLVRAGVRFSNTAVDQFISGISAIITLVYLLVALRRVYQDPIIVAAVKAAVLVFSMYWIMMLYRFILFVVSLYSA
jgi:thiamine biosynthesis protein ThiS